MFVFAQDMPCRGLEGEDDEFLVVVPASMCHSVHVSMFHAECDGSVVEVVCPASVVAGDTVAIQVDRAGLMTL